MDVSDGRKLKALEDESAKLKKLLAERMLERALCAIGSSTMTSAMLKDVASRKW